MATARAFATLATPAAEQRMLIEGVTWKDYVILREALDTPGLRMTYLEGRLELMSPSMNHELHKKTIARLVELYAVMRRLPLIGYGGTTFRREAKQRGLEPDECYCVGRQIEEGQFPDIALEVVETSPLLDKLEVYRGLDVREVWVFQDAAFQIFRLTGGGYQPAERSELLPELEFALIARFAVRRDQHDALVEFQQLLSQRGT